MYGFTLNGLLVASTIKSGVRKDDGVPYARRISVVSVGTGVVTYSESVDPVTNPEPHPLNKEITVTNITYTNTNGGMVSVNGDCKISK
jgi:hypothetical protein